MNRLYEFGEWCHERVPSPIVFVLVIVLWLVLPREAFWAFAEGVG